MRPSLRELQLELETLFSQGGRSGFAQTAAAAARRLPIAGDARLAAADRLSIYSSMVFLRIREAIGEDFPASVAAVGDDGWTSLVADYLEAHPTDDPSLRQAGRHLPEFLRSGERAALPWQAELAELEWAMVRAFDAADESPLRAEALDALPEDAWADLPLQTVKSLVILAPNFPVDEIREQLLEGKPPLAAPAQGALRVWRQGFTVFHRRIDELEAGALEQLERGLSFGALCEWLVERVPDEEVATTGFELLRSWLADEILVAPATGAR